MYGRMCGRSFLAVEEQIGTSSRQLHDHRHHEFACCTVGAGLYSGCPRLLLRGLGHFARCSTDADAGGRFELRYPNRGQDMGTIRAGQE